MSGVSIRDHDANEAPQIVFAIQLRREVDDKAFLPDFGNKDRNDPLSFFIPVPKPTTNSSISTWLRRLHSTPFNWTPRTGTPQAEALLGRILADKGDTHGALRYLNAYLALAPKADDADEIAGLLRSCKIPRYRVIFYNTSHLAWAQSH